MINEDQSSTKTACPTGPITDIVILPEDDASPVHIELSNWDQIDDFLTRDHDEHPGQWKMFILNGLHTKLAFELAMRLDVDPGFFDCHIYRTRYTAPRRGVKGKQHKNKATRVEGVNGGAGVKRGEGAAAEQEQEQDGQVSFFQLDFPQVEQLAIPVGVHMGRSSELHLLESPWMMQDNSPSLAPDARKAYLLDGTMYRWDGMLVGSYGYWRRMSWWCSAREKMSLMIIDAPLEAVLPAYASPAALTTQPFRSNVRRHDSSANASEALDALYLRWRQRRRPETFLERFLAGGNGNGTAHKVYSIAADMALEQCAALLAAVQVDRGSSSHSHSQSQSQSRNHVLEITAQRIENNTLDSERLGRDMTRWREMSTLLPQRRDAALAHTVSRLHDRLQHLERKMAPSSGAKNDELAGEVRGARRALNRLSYMGGVLLPFSIVAGVFSMAGDFRAGQRLFFVYWALAVPGMLLAVVLVYADTLGGGDARARKEAAGDGLGKVFWRRIGRHLGRRRARDSTSSDSSSASGESHRSGGADADADGAEMGRRGMGMGSLRLSGGVSRPVWPWSVGEDVVRVETTEELGWRRALRTLNGHWPQRGDREDGQ